MSPVQRRRLLLVLLVLAVAGIAAALVATALQRNIAYLYTPAEVRRSALMVPFCPMAAAISSSSVRM